MFSMDDKQVTFREERPLFDSKHAKFQVWWTCLEAYIGVFGFLSALQTGGESDMPAPEEVQSSIK
jgi:hypothetical protein